MERNRGKETCYYLYSGQWTIPDWVDPYHGQSYVLSLALLERIFIPEKPSRHLFPDDNTRWFEHDTDMDLQSIYTFRHRMNFLLFFAGVVAFFLLAVKTFQDWKLGLLSCLILLLSPRIFAHSFFNPKDLPFLSVFVIAVYTMLNYFDKKTFAAAAIHGIVCAFLIGIRIMGILVPFLTCCFLLYENLAHHKKVGHEPVCKQSNFTIYIAYLVPFTVFFWPLLWSRPLVNFTNAFLDANRHTWPGFNLFAGRLIPAADLPRYYIPVWILITTPLSYIFLFITGLFALMRRAGGPGGTRQRNLLICALWFFLPLLTVVILRSTLYDGWRQMFFIYPALVIIAVYGWHTLYGYLSRHNAPRFFVYLRLALIVVLIVQLGSVGSFMVRSHPYQHVYFGDIAYSHFLDVDKDGFERDYWALSMREALEYILSQDDREEVKVHPENWIPQVNSYMLSREKRGRLRFVSQIDAADYYITHYRWHMWGHVEFPPQGASRSVEEFYSISVDGVNILTVFRLN